MINIIIHLFHRLKTTKADWKWQLQPYGRFAHNKDYVTSVGNDYALQTVHYEEMNGFRRQGKHYVRGHIFIMQKQLNDEL
jgi:predicted TPR repeat methyltransferase